jgi:hypothetical protein
MYRKFDVTEFFFSTQYFFLGSKQGLEDGQDDLQDVGLQDRGGYLLGIPTLALFTLQKN